MMIPKTNLMPDFCNRRQPYHYLTALNLLSGIGINIDRVRLLAIGTFYNYRGEVHEQDPPPNSILTGETEITLKVGCFSAVDYMPYQFFYGMGKRLELSHKWERSARFLMAPFDAAVIRHHAQMRYQSLQYEGNIVEAEHLRRLLDLFDLPMPDENMSVDDILYWLSILPGFYLWGGSPEAVATILSRTFGCTFRIRENIKSTTAIPGALQYKLGSKTGRLGRETILGNEFAEYDSAYEIVIENVSPEKVPELLPGGKTRRKIENLLRFCMPADLEATIKIKVDRPDRKTEEGFNQYLGYSSYLN